jgi:hypothetical protein
MEGWMLPCGTPGTTTGPCRDQVRPPSGLISTHEVQAAGFQQGIRGSSATFLRRRPAIVLAAARPDRHVGSPFTRAAEPGAEQMAALVEA